MLNSETLTHIWEFHLTGLDTPLSSLLWILSSQFLKLKYCRAQVLDLFSIPR